MVMIKVQEKFSGVFIDQFYCKINAVEHFSFLFEGLIKAVKRVLTIIILLFEIYNYPERDHWERSQIDLRL